MIKFIINIITWIKVRLLRSMSYMGMANSIMLILVLLKVEDNLLLNKYKFHIAFFWFILLVLLGQLEILSKTPHKESERMLELQPPLKFIHTKVGKIDDKLKEIEILIRELNLKRIGEEK